MKDFIEGIRLAEAEKYITQQEATRFVREYIEITLELNRGDYKKKEVKKNV